MHVSCSEEKTNVGTAGQRGRDSLSRQARFQGKGSGSFCSDAACLCHADDFGRARLGEDPADGHTGLVGSTAEDDSLPRWAVVFLIPGLMCLLNVIVHGQLMLHQSKMKIPPKQIRVVGRWGIPIVGTFLSAGMIQYAAGEAVLPLPFTASCILCLAMMLLGGHLWDWSHKRGALAQARLHRNGSGG